MQKKKWRLLHQLLLLSAIGLIPLSLIGAWGITSAIQEQQNELERSALDLSRALTSAVDAELDATIGTLRTLSYAESLSAGNIRHFYRNAREAAAEHSGWLSIILTDGKGQWIFNTGLPVESRNGPVVDPTSLNRAIQSRTPVVGNIAMGPSKRLAFPVRVPVIRDGRVNYILSAAVTPDRILEILHRQNVPPSWVISVFDASGRRVARSKGHENTVGTPASPSLSKLIQEGKSEGTGITRTLEGDESFTGYTRIPRYGWTVAVGAPTTYFRAYLVRTISTYALGILGSLALCLTVAWFISRRILVDIGGLRDRAIQLGQGKPVDEMSTKIREVEDVAHALQLAAKDRVKGEQDREALLETLNTTLQSLREALAAAEEAGRAKDEFLAVLSHELRNPLAPIVTALQLMEVKGDNSSVRERQVMQRQVDHMRRLVDDLLDVSRITRGKFDIRREPTELQSIVQRVVEAMQPMVSERSGKIRLQMPSAPILVIGDDTRLVQVFTNLLSNALRFTPSGEVSVRIELHGSHATVSVEDHGLGMTEETLENVFKPFYQAPQALARSTGGLGLGLAIVHSIVELHGGKVSASSEGLNKGSVFQVVLPVSTAALKPTSNPVSVAVQSTAKILVVDDNIDAAQTVADGLRMAGHNVTVAHHPTEALAMLARLRPDVAILDIGLPEMDGYELAKAMRTQGGVAGLIALTGYGLAIDKTKSTTAGFDLHLTKPVDLRDLLRKIDELLSEQTAED